MRKIILYSVSAFAIAASFSIPAAAGSDYIVGISPSALSPVYNAVNNEAQSNSRAASAAATNIIQALQQMSGQLTANNQATVNGMGNVATVQDNRRVQMANQEAKYSAENQATNGSSACNTITGALAGSGLSAAMAIYTEQATAAEVGWMTGGSDAHPALSHNGPDAAMAAVISQHCAYAATGGDVDDGLCPAKTNPSGSGGQNQASAPADVMFGEAIVSSQNDVLTASELKARAAFMAEAFSPDAAGAMPKGSAKSQIGREVAYDQIVNGAQRAIALGVSNLIIGRNTPMPDGTQVAGSQNSTPTQNGGTTINSSPVSLKSWAVGTMKQVVNGQQAPAGGWFPGGVSYDAWLGVRAQAWFLNPNWEAQVNDYSEVSAVKDLTLIEAYRAYLQFQQYKGQESTNLLLAQDTVLLQKIANNMHGSP